MTQNATEPRGGTYSLEFANPGLVILKDHPPQLHKVVAVPDALGKELAHLHLHSFDLQKAAGYLDELDKRGYPPEGDTINDALWHAALITMFKCFGTSRARNKLDPTRIYSDDQLNEFRFWKSMRDKNLAHDDNDAFQAHVCAVLRKWQYVPTIDSVKVFVMEGVTLTEKNAAVLRDLLDTAREWVREEEKRRQRETEATRDGGSAEPHELRRTRRTATRTHHVHKPRDGPPHAHNTAEIKIGRIPRNSGRPRITVGIREIPTPTPTCRRYTGLGCPTAGTESRSNNPHRSRGSPTDASSHAAAHRGGTSPRVVTTRPVGRSAAVTAPSDAARGFVCRVELASTRSSRTGLPPSA